MRRIFLALLILVAGLSLAGCGSAKLEQQDEAVIAAWSTAAREYQRRADLVPEVIAAFAAAARDQAPAIERVNQARARAATVPLTPALLEQPRDFEAMQLAQESLGDALRELFTAADQDPALTADLDYVALRALWQAAEQRIATARDHYIRAVAVYNASVSSFPTNITAGMFDFERKPGFTRRN